MAADAASASRMVPYCCRHLAAAVMLKALARHLVSTWQLTQHLRVRNSNWRENSREISVLGRNNLPAQLRPGFRGHFL